MRIYFLKDGGQPRVSRFTRGTPIGESLNANGYYYSRMLVASSHVGAVSVKEKPIDGYLGS